MSSPDSRTAIVHVVDDQPAMLRLVAELVESVSLKAATYESAKDFLNRYFPRPCECLVSDVRMPEMGGLEFYHALRAKGYVLPVIFITGYAEVGTAVEAMKAGAFDYVEKPFQHQTFLDKVNRALAASESLFAQSQQKRARDARMALLTASELKILKLVAEGKSSREVADMLGISSRTVDNHRGRMMEKLHVNSVVELVLAYTEGKAPNS